MIVHISESLKSSREVLQLINTISKGAGYKINSKKSLALPYTNDKWTEKEPFLSKEHPLQLP
jgi:hypothetical protein